MQKHRIAVAVIAMIATFCISQSGEASYRQPKRSASSYVEFDAPTLAPLSYTRFCMRYQDECQRTQPELGLAEPPEVMGPFVTSFSDKVQLVEINRLVNRAISPRHYVGTAAFDSWAIAPAAGDCNDYAITKRSLLRQSGWPPERLLLAEVQIPTGEHHLILVVRMDGEDVVLDNLSGAVRNWSKSPYRWVRIQSSTEAHIWQTLRQSGPDLMS